MVCYERLGRLQKGGGSGGVLDQIGFAIQAEEMVSSKGDLKESCLIKIYLVWHYEVVKGADEMVRMKKEVTRS